MPRMEIDHDTSLRQVWSEMSETEKQEFRYEFQRIMREELFGRLQLIPLADDCATMQATIGDLTTKLEEAHQREKLYKRVVDAAEGVVWCDRATPLDWGERRLSEALSALNKEDERPEVTCDEQRS